MKGIDENISLQIYGLLEQTPTGQQVMAYLKSITVHMIAGPDSTDQQLRHLEGQRFLVGLMQQRIEHGRQLMGSQEAAQ
jgi:hypothetical protein